RLVDASRIEKTLLQSNIILESFGNAKTVCNQNSSRFGKFMCFHFDANQILIGSSLQIYLLEKPRSLFDMATLDSSFHVFRLFLSSLTETELTEFGLDTLDEDYVNDMKSRRMCSVDVATWNDLVRSLVALDFSMVDISQLRLLLASIVLLNAVRFLPASPSPSDAPVNIRVRLLSHASKDSLASNENCLATDVNGATAEIHPDDLEKVFQAGRLLGLPNDALVGDFARQLVTRHVQAGTGSNAYRSRRLTEYSTTCSVSQAKEQRDCLVKALYSSLFDFLVQTVNDHLDSRSLQKAQREFGILDLFGFEVFEENGFEQFCINYANERLHQAFMRIAVNSVENEMKSEGLCTDCLPPHETHDNSALLTSVKVCAGLLDEVCLLNRVYDRGSRSANPVDQLDTRETDWLRCIQAQMVSDDYVFVGPGMSPTPKIKRNVSSNKTWSSSTGTVQSVPPGLRRVTDCFTVRHFAGPVTYSVSGFVAKNFDRLPTHLINWLTDATQSDLSVGSNKSPTDEVTKPTLIQFVLTRVATGAVAGRDISASPSPGRSPLRQQNSPASSVTTRPNSSSGKHLSMRVNLQREIAFYQSSLNCLLERLEAHRISFVRCIRPVLTSSSLTHSAANFKEFVNSPALPRLEIDKVHVKSQLVAGGLFDALLVLRAAFPARYKYGDFIRRYRMFWRLRGEQPSKIPDNGHIVALSDRYTKLFELEHIPPNRTASFQRRDTGESETQHLQQIVLLLLIFGLQINSPPDGVSDQSGDAAQPEWSSLIRQFGRTRIYLTRIQMQHLDRIRGLMRTRAARTIQRWFRLIRTYSFQSNKSEEADVQTLSPIHLQSVACTQGTLLRSDGEVHSSPRTLRTTLGPDSFPTHSTHIVSCRRLLDHSTSFCNNPVRYWCLRKLRRLDSLIPFIHIPLTVSPCLTRGLIDAVL
ncbi:hypothetical protein FBUS_00056, partial [Fasciolopsis buskii]